MNGPQEDRINYRAWSRSMIGFIRERGLEVEFKDWCGGWPCPINSDAAPELLDVNKSALEFSVMFLAFTGRDRGTDRLGKTLDDLTEMAVALDAKARSAIAKAETQS